jgi:DNA-binding response OmpR family regulator
MDHLRKLLIIDDDEGDRRLIYDVLRNADFNMDISMAEDGEKGLQKAKELKSGMIVITDTRMPGMDGFETCKKIKETVTGAMVIICTGVVDAVDAAKARDAGADDYCVKTSDGGPLINSIRNLMGS